LKEKHGLRWTNYRGLERNQMQAMLVCAAMNLKKLANCLWRMGISPLFQLCMSLFSSVHQGRQMPKWNKMFERQVSSNHFVNSLRGLLCPLFFFTNFLPTVVSHVDDSFFNCFFFSCNHT
ncbi:transposase, partial [Anoxybacillus sp. LAT_31]